MPNALNPNSVLDDFLARAAASLDRYAALDQLVAAASGTHSLTLRRGLAADTVFRLGTEWEIFQHRWHIAAISRRQSVYRTLVQDQLTRGIDKGAVGHIISAVAPEAATLPQRLTGAQIEGLVDSEGYNLSFKDCEVWAATAVKHLDPHYASRVQAVVGDAEASSPVDLLKAVRNALAHSSVASLGRLNACAKKRTQAGSVGLAGAANDGLVRDGRSIRDVPTYVQAWIPVAQTRRVVILHDRISVVAESLRV